MTLITLTNETTVKAWQIPWPVLLFLQTQDRWGHWYLNAWICSISHSWQLCHYTLIDVTDLKRHQISRLLRLLFYTAISNHLCQSCFCAGYCADCCAVCRLLCNILTEENIRCQKLISWCFIFTLLNSCDDSWLCFFAIQFYAPASVPETESHSGWTAWGLLVLLGETKCDFQIKFLLWIPLETKM